MTPTSNGKLKQYQDGTLPGLHLINPFVHKLELEDPFDKLKTAVFTVLLLPFRVILICLLLILAWMLACIGLWGLSIDDLRKRPMTGWRRRLKNVICFVGRTSYLAGGMAITVKGRQAPRHEAPILVVAPHSTFLDSVIVYVTNMSTVIVRKESMDNYIGKLINYTQPIYVWRDDPDSRQNTIKSIIERANSTEDWPQIILFPEGTCTNRSCLITFKPGAFYPGVPIQPVCIRYPNKLDTVTWTWEGPGVLKLLWLTLTQVHSACEVEFLPVYVPSTEEKANPKLYAKNVRNVMSKALGLPISDYTYDDCRVLERAKEMNLPCALNIVDVDKLRHSIGLDQTNIEEQVVISQLVNDANCNVSYADFCLRLQIASNHPYTNKLFSLFDKHSNGTIDFREYLLCALFIIKSSQPKIKLLYLAFKMYENAGTAGISKISLFQVLNHTLAMSLEETESIFSQITHSNRDHITFDEFAIYAEQKAEFSHLFSTNDRHHQNQNSIDK